jgi:hypothetical protein
MLEAQLARIPPESLRSRAVERLLEAALQLARAAIRMRVALPERPLAQLGRHPRPATQAPPQVRAVAQLVPLAAPPELPEKRQRVRLAAAWLVQAA